jgi:sugar O-acyltransferase (sialic acid O-acetyltransferase NeuD family)
VRVVVIGGGGAGREMLDVIEAVNASGAEPLEVLGVLDDGSPDSSKLAAYGPEHLGPVESLASMPQDVGYLIGIGSPRARAQIDAAHRGRPCPVVVHPSAVVARGVELGPGTLVAAHAVFMSHVSTGRHVHVSVGCSIGHDAVLEDYVEVSPTTALSGFVIARRQAFFGTGAKVNPGLTVGQEAVVGTGAAVIRDVAPRDTVVGVPARALGRASGSGR